MTDIRKLEDELKSLSTNRQADFSKSLTPGSAPMLGVKLPQLRKIAKRIAREDYKSFLEECPDDWFEYEILKAYVLGYAKDDIDVILSYADRFIPKIHDWAVNDTFCQNFTIAETDRDKSWRWIMGYVPVQREFTQRTAAVLLMCHFLVDEYIDSVLECMDKLRYDGYYTKMGVAWCIATAYVKYPDKTMSFLRSNKLDNWTYNKAIQKMCESYRVSDEDKQILKKMKRQTIRDKS